MFKNEKYYINLNNNALIKKSTFDFKKIPLPQNIFEITEDEYFEILEYNNFKIVNNKLVIDKPTNDIKQSFNYMYYIHQMNLIYERFLKNEYGLGHLINDEYNLISTNLDNNDFIQKYGIFNINDIIDNENKYAELKRKIIHNVLNSKMNIIKNKNNPKQCEEIYNEFLNIINTHIKGHN